LATYSYSKKLVLIAARAFPAGMADIAVAAAASQSPIAPCDGSGLL